jgi:hypothetical protein
MVSPVLNENYYAGAFLVSQANGTRSRDSGIIKNTGGSDLVLQGGTVLGLLTADGSYFPYDNVGSDGSEVASAILYAPIVVPAGGQKRVTLVTRHVEVNASELRWDASVDAAGITAGLADLLTKGIVAR